MDSISLCLPLIIRSCGILPLMRSRHWRNVKVGSAWLIQSHCSRVSELYSRTLGSENGHLCSLILASEDHGHFETHCRIIENHGTLETQSPSIRILRLDGLVYAAILQMARMSPWVQKRFAQHLVAPSSRTGLTPYLLIPTQGSYLLVRDKTPWLQTQEVGQMEGGRTKVGGRRKMHVPEGKIFSFEAQQNHRVGCHEAPLFFPASSSATLCIPFSPPTSAHSTTKLLLPL